MLMLCKTTRQDAILTAFLARVVQTRGGNKTSMETAASTTIQMTVKISIRTSVRTCAARLA